MSRVSQIICGTALFWLAAMPGGAAAPAGEVVYAHGLTSIQRDGEPARFVTKGDAINEGDVISTGTPSGVGMFMNPPRWLKKGDVVECAVEGIGSLRNTVD